MYNTTGVFLVHTKQSFYSKEELSIHSTKSTPHLIHSENSMFKIVLKLIISDIYPKITV